jgi:hypothetical protein
VDEDSGEKEEGEAKPKRKDGIDPVEDQPPIGDIGCQNSEGRVGDIDHLHDPPAEAEAYSKEGKDASHHDAANHGLKNHHRVKHKGLALFGFIQEKTERRKAFASLRDERLKRSSGKNHYFHGGFG